MVVTLFVLFYLVFLGTGLMLLSFYADENAKHVRILNNHIYNTNIKLIQMINQINQIEQVRTVDKIQITNVVLSCIKDYERLKEKTKIASNPNNKVTPVAKHYIKDPDTT